MSDFRFVDFDEQRLVVLVDRDGRYEVRKSKMCSVAAADLLRHIACELEAQHPPFPCEPAAEPDGPAGRPVEPLDSPGGSLDRERKVWTDGRGHTWDLSLAWRDAADRPWRWHGSLDSRGAPILRTEDGVERESLDVVRAVYGPLAPVVGGGE